MLAEFSAGFFKLLVYFFLCASGALVLRRFVKMHPEVFRKTLHMILLGSIFVLVYAFPAWHHSAIAAVAFMVLVFPILMLAERLPGYSRLLTERKCGELKTSLIVVFLMFAVLICVCWGLIGEKYLVIASVLAWGLGDAAAALVGKRYGQHYIEGKLVEGRKSLEGTFAMFAVSFVTVTAILVANGTVRWYCCAPIAFLTAAACAAVELYTRRGMDTLTCPFTAAAILIPLVRLWGA